jgi:hypothetical protein
LDLKARFPDAITPCYIAIVRNIDGGGNQPEEFGSEAGFKTWFEVDMATAERKNMNMAGTIVVQISSRKKGSCKVIWYPAEGIYRMRRARIPRIPWSQRQIARKTLAILNGTTPVASLLNTSAALVGTVIEMNINGEENGREPFSGHRLSGEYSEDVEQGDMAVFVKL